MEEDQQKITYPFTAIVAGALLVILLAIFIYAQRSNILKGLRKTTSKETVELTISDSDKTTDIEKELESTDLGTFNSDIESLEKDASSL